MSELPYDPSIPLLGIRPEEFKAVSEGRPCTPVHTAALVTTAKSDRWADKLTDHPHSGLLSSLKKVSSDTCYHTDKPWERYAKRNRPGTKRETLHNLLMKVFKEAKLRDRKQRGRCQGLGAGGRGRWCWIRFARWKNSKDLLHNQVSKIHVFKWLRWPCVCVLYLGKVLGRLNNYRRV